MLAAPGVFCVMISREFYRASRRGKLRFPAYVHHRNAPKPSIDTCATNCAVGVDAHIDPF